jgi:hypothetical protein
MDSSSQNAHPSAPAPSLKGSDGSIFRHALIAFVIAVIVYFVFFAFDQYLRKRKGGWIVEFQKNEQAEPRLVIHQPHLGITNVQITITGEAITNDAAAVVFDNPKKVPPFGKLVYHDLTYLPGAIVIELLGHEIQMIPRTLVIDKKERGWTNGAVFTLEAK